MRLIYPALIRRISLKSPHFKSSYVSRQIVLIQSLLRQYYPLRFKTRTFCQTFGVKEFFALYSGCCFSKNSKSRDALHPNETETLIHNPILSMDDNTSSLIQSTSTDLTSASNLTPEKQSNSENNDMDINKSTDAIECLNPKESVEPIKNPDILVDIQIDKNDQLLSATDTLLIDLDNKLSGDQTLENPSVSIFKRPAESVDINTVDNCHISPVKLAKIDNNSTPSDELVELSAAKVDLPLSQIKTSHEGKKSDKDPNIPMQSKKSKSKKGRKNKDENSEQKRRPNYFVAFQVSNPEIYEKVKEVQEKIINCENRLKKCAIGLPTLHITILVMYIANAEEQSRALKALKDVYDNFNDSFVNNPLKLEFKGVGNFDHKVIFASAVMGEALNRLTEFANYTIAHFKSEGIKMNEKDSDFKPHLTLMKLSKDPSLFRKGVRKINPSFYSEFKDQMFGFQTVDGIQLLSMDEPKDENGYYTGNEYLFKIKG